MQQGFNANNVNRSTDASLIVPPAWVWEGEVSDSYWLEKPLPQLYIHTCCTFLCVVDASVGTSLYFVPGQVESHVDHEDTSAMPSSFLCTFVQATGCSDGPTLEG